MVCFFEKMKIILKANLLKGRVAKPKGTKVRKLDHVSRLPLFPYHHNHHDHHHDRHHMSNPRDADCQGSCQ